MAEIFSFEQSKKSTEEKSEQAQLNLVELKEKAGGIELSKSPLLLAQNGKDQGFMMPIDNYLIAVEEQEKEQSYFKTATTYATRLARTALGMEDASSKFDKARESGNQGIMYQLYEADRTQRDFEDKFGNYSAAILKTALLFTGGKVGWSGLTAVTASDQAKPSDPFKKQAADAVLGAAKGLASSYLFNKLNETSWNPVSKGWVFGAGSRFIEVSLTSDNYLNKDGSLDSDSFSSGLKKTFMSVAGPEALATDLGTAAVSHLTLLPANYFMGGAYFKHALASKLTMAGVSGLTNGSLRELNRQQDQLPRVDIDWAKVAEKGLEKGTLDTLSALPGARFFGRRF